MKIGSKEPKNRLKLFIRIGSRIAELGEDERAQWKREVGYHRRSRIETLMFRLKTTLGDKLASRKECVQITEVMIKLDALNRMMELGMPETYKVST